MNGMEMMLSRLIGLKPEEMKAKVTEATQLMEHGAKAMAQMQKDLNDIKKHLGIENIGQELIENGGRTTERRNNTNGNHIQL